MARLFVQRRVKPYQSNGRTTFSIQGKPGVYLIYQKDEIVYIGYSGTNLYKTMYRHFQKWTDKTQHRVVYPDHTGITVRVVYTNNGYRASRLERALILKYTPKDNTVIYEEEIFTPSLARLSNEYMGENINPIVTSTEDLPF